METTWIDVWDFLMEHGWMAIRVKGGYLFVPSSNCVH